MKKDDVQTQSAQRPQSILDVFLGELGDFGGQTARIHKRYA